MRGSAFQRCSRRDRYATRRECEMQKVLVLFLSRDSTRVQRSIGGDRRVNVSALATPCHPRLHGIARNLL